METKELERELVQKEISLGEKIYQMLEGYSPKDKKMALREAEERVHKNYDNEMQKINAMSEALEKEWNEFKNS